MRIPSIKVILSGGFWSGLLATVLGIVLTFGTSMLIEHHVNEVHKQQFLICMVQYIDSQIDGLVSDSVEAAQIDSLISPVLMNFSETGELPTRQQLNEITPVFTSFRLRSENEGFRDYFEGNTETLQLLDSYTITQFNAVSSIIDNFVAIKLRREQCRENLQNMLLAHVFSGNSANENYWKTVARQLMTNPTLSAYWLNNTEYRYMINLFLPQVRAIRACIMSVHDFDEEDIARYNLRDPYPAAWQRYLDENGALRDSIHFDVNDSARLTINQ